MTLLGASPNIRELTLRSAEKDSLLHCLEEMQVKDYFPAFLDDLTPIIFSGSQSIEVLTLHHVVNVELFFRLCLGSNSSSNPNNITWPSLRVLKIYAIFDPYKQGREPSGAMTPDFDNSASQLSIGKAVTDGLPRRPHIMALSINILDENAVNTGHHNPISVDGRPIDRSKFIYDADVTVLPRFLIDLQLQPGQATKRRYNMESNCAVLRLSSFELTPAQEQAWNTAVCKPGRAVCLKVVVGQFKAQSWLEWVNERIAKKNMEAESDDKSYSLSATEMESQHSWEWDSDAHADGSLTGETWDGPYIPREFRAIHLETIGEECDLAAENEDGYENKERRWKYWEDALEARVVKAD